MELTLGRVLCGDDLNDTGILIESIRRLKDFCMDVVAKIRTNSADAEDAVRGIAFSYDLSLLIGYYESHNIEGLDDADLFLAKEAAEAAMNMSIDLFTRG